MDFFVSIWSGFCGILGFIMKVCYDVIGRYGLAIIVFTLLTKVIMLPASILVQKNSVKMVKMKPKLDLLRYQYAGDKDGLVSAQSALYKEEKYKPFLTFVPLIIQMVLVFGLVDVIYAPLTHLLGIDAAVLEKMGEAVRTIKGADTEHIELSILKYAQMSEYSSLFTGIDASAAELISSVDTQFLGINLSDMPDHLGLITLIPIISGASSFVQCWIQNKVNVLQQEQGFFGKWGVTLITVGISLGLAFVVPAGVGLYWIFGNLFAIPVLYLMNIIIDPKKYIDYKTLNMIKEKEKRDAEKKKRDEALCEKYYAKIKENHFFRGEDVVFYSEGSGFYKYFENIIESLLSDSDIVIHYVTSDPDDAIFKKESERIKPYFITGNRLISLMIRIQCKMVVMTTPDLEKYHIKRSKVKPDVEYVYTDHGCSSMNLTYRTGALDCYDTVFVVSRAQGLELRAMEALRGTHKKRIVKVGYGLIDNMIENYKKSGTGEEKHEKPIILIGPSWTNDNIMDSCLDDMLSSLLGGKYHIIVRPHPQYVRRYPVRMEALFEKYKDKLSEDFEIQTDFSSNKTVYSSDIMITDWSGIAFEYSFTTNKPTLFVDTEMKVMNADYRKIDIVPFDIEARNLVGKSVSKEQTKKMSEYVDDLLVNYKGYSEQIDELRQKTFYNPGCSGKAGADYIIRRVKGIPFEHMEK